jgi:putative inorganic carbon (hco3(-)) transporter
VPAEVGGVLGAAGLAALVLTGPRWARLGGLAAWAAGIGLLALELAPEGRPALLAAGVAGGLVAGLLLAALFLRLPWLVPMLALACVPIRIPVDVDGEEANLLVPLYAVVAGVALALAWRLARRDGRARELGPLAWPLAAFVAWSGLSMLWTEDVREAAIQLLAFYLPFGLLAVWIARLEWSRRWLGVLAAELVALALAFAAIGVFQWLTRDVFWNPKVIVGNAYAPFYRVNSVFWDPSIYGRFLVVAILACVSLVLLSARTRVLWAAAAAAAAIWVGLVFSFSQSSFAALVVAVLAATAVVWGRRAVLALAAVALVLVSVGFTAPSVRDELRRDLDRATSGRAGLVEHGVRIAAGHPLAGVGLGGFVHAYAERTGLRGEAPRRAASHNTPITVAAETGLPGIALFAWLLGSALVITLRRASRSFAGRASLMVALSLMAIAVHSLAYDAFFEDPMTWGYLGLTALVASWRGSGEPA